MSVTIWGRHNSTNVKKALWAAAELGVAVDSIEVGGQFGGLDTPEYTAMNPNGLIPVLKDRDLVMYESNAIVRYLWAAYGAETGGGDGGAAEAAAVTAGMTADAGGGGVSAAAARARADQWMDWVATTLQPAFRPVFWGVVRTPAAQQDQAGIKAGIARMEELLAVPEAHLATHPFLSGAQLGMGDIPLGAIAYAWFEMPIARAAFPNLERWYADLKKRKAFRDTVVIPLT